MGAYLAETSAPARTPDAVGEEAGPARHHRHRRRHRHGLRHAVFARLTYGGIVLGLLAWWWSIYPTLLPRGWMAQGVISALCFGLGYMVGTLGGWIVHVILHRTGRDPGPSARRTAWLVLLMVAAVVLAAGAVFWFVWQNDQRALVGLDDLRWTAVPSMLLFTPVVAAILFAIGRLFWFVVRAIDRFATRFMPRPVAIAVTGALEREMLAVVTTTGSGWIDPNAARVLETLHAGNTALVGMQCSYLPSWISFLVDADEARAAGRALYGAVHDAWTDLPADSRPRLLVFGLSLGSFGAETPFVGSDVAASVAAYTSGADGVLLVGPTDSNPVYQQLLAARQPSTPVWLPVYDDGRSVRFANRPSDVQAPFSGWDGTRVLYFHHPSDPVGLWNWETLWSRPESMNRPRGYDVPDGGPWVPVVTWIQTVHDLIAGFSAPAGHGHDYSSDYVAAFAAVVPPDGWTQADTDRLSDLLHTPLTSD